MIFPETPTLALASSDRILYHPISEYDEQLGYDHWQVSEPIPGVQIINVWEIYFNVWIALTRSENGHYRIFRTIDGKNFSPTHDRASKVYGVFWLDAGHMILSAADGCCITPDAGLSWIELWSGGTNLQPQSIVIIDMNGGVWTLVAYGRDKIYMTAIAQDLLGLSREVLEFDLWDELPITSDDPDLDAEVPEFESWDEVPVFADIPVDWTMVYDTTPIWQPGQDKHYLAMAGGPTGVLAGVGNKLIRSLTGSSGSWQIIQEVNGTIKGIVTSNRTNRPVFLIEIEQSSQDSRFYWTYDLGDSLVPDLGRTSPIASVQSVYPTGQGQIQTMFAVLGQRTPGGRQEYKILSGGQ